MSCKWKRLGEEELRKLLEETIARTGSMRAASASLQMNFQTFRKYAKNFNLWTPNPAGKGLLRKTPVSAIPIQEILEGKHPTFSTGALKRRLLREGLKKNECEECGISSWQGKPLITHLDHKNGNHWDHHWENLRMLCPNCHSQTPTWCGRNASVAERYTPSI